MLGTCRQLSIGPEAALSLLVGGIITEIIAETDHDLHRPLSQSAKTKISIEVATGMGLQVRSSSMLLGQSP
jgi:MFS superfamily sulfate permease-like transporter